MFGAAVAVLVVHAPDPPLTWEVFTDLLPSSNDDGTGVGTVDIFFGSGALPVARAALSDGSMPQWVR